MKGLTLTQPWASLVAHGIKHIETRGKGTPYRGPIAIHAAKEFRSADHGTLKSGRAGLLEYCRFQVDIKRALQQAQLDPGTLPMGAIVGAGELVDVVRHDTDNRLPDAVVSRFMVSLLERELGGYGPSRVYWLLKDVRPVEPVPFRGALYLFDVPDGVLGGR